MKHTSVLKLNSPIEFIESTRISPFISKVLIKVCYVGDEPNRNRSIITKDVARDLAPSLRGCPIVGFFNETAADFEEHNRQIDISNGQWKITDTTTPYGFVDLNAKIWFATYIDDNENEHEYLCTEGYIWDHAYPEAKRVSTLGNNQSMELDEGTIDATWSKDENGNPEFFIINEALIEKLCILGENVEPCFEGSQITSFSLVVDKSFENKLFAMIGELKELLTEGGKKVFNTYAVEIGDALWSALYAYIEKTYPDGENMWCSKYSIDGVFEEEGQKFAILFDRAEMKYYRLDFSLTEAEGFSAAAELVEVTKTYTPAEQAQFAAEEVEEFISNYIQVKTDEQNQNNNEEVVEEINFSIEEAPEYIELQNQYNELFAQVDSFKNNIEELNAQIETLNNELNTLREFKKSVDHEKKMAKIAEFYMLSDEDKKDVIENIDTYSLDDIEAKLSVICFRNKVSFTSEDDDDSPANGPTTFSLEEDLDDDSSTPAWVKAALNVAKNMNN